jgi:hypothetical protein
VDNIPGTTIYRSYPAIVISPEDCFEVAAVVFADENGQLLTDGHPWFSAF